MNTGDPKFEAMISDPDFQKLPEDHQNQLVDEYKERVMGSIPSHENLLQRTMRNTPGIIGELSKPYAPSAMRIGGQIAGGMVGGYPGAIGGETLADLGSQGLESLKSGNNQFNIGDIGKNTAITAATEGLGRGIGKLFTGNAATRSVVNEAGEKLGDIKTALGDLGEANPELSIPKGDVLQHLTEMFSKIKNPMGAGAKVMNKWINLLSDDSVTHITPDMAMQMENEFGQAAKYMNPKSFMENIIYKMKNPIAQPYLNNAVKGARTVASDVVNNMADSIGASDFGDLSEKFSEGANLLKEGGSGSKLLDALSGGSRVLGEVGGGLGIGQAFHHPLVGATLGILDLIRRNPAVQDAIYNSVSKTGLGNMATTGISELLRKSGKNY